MATKPLRYLVIVAQTAGGLQTKLNDVDSAYTLTHLTYSVERSNIVAVLENHMASK